MGWVAKREGIKYKLAGLETVMGRERCSMGNTVNNILIIMSDAKRGIRLIEGGGLFVSYINV